MRDSDRANSYTLMINVKLLIQFRAVKAHARFQRLKCAIFRHFARLSISGVFFFLKNVLNTNQSFPAV